MSDDPTFFRPAIEPFRDLWQKLRIAGVAVLRNDRWISMSTRIAFSHLGPEPDFFIEPAPDFVGFSSDLPLSALDELLQDVGSKGSFKVQVGNQPFEIFLTLAHANAEPNPQQIRLGPPFSTLTHQHDGRLEFGASQFRLSNINVENQPRVISYDQLNAVSSLLRVHVPAYSGVTELLTYLGAPFDKHQNQTSFDIAAPLPFSMVCSDSTVSVSGPRIAMQHLRVIGFFDTGRATTNLKEVGGTDPSGLGLLSGAIPWPERSKSEKLFLYFRKQEVGSVSVRRWVGTTSWRIQVQEFFDKDRAILKKGLETRKEQTEFEISVVRLLNELRTPTIWYGDHQYQDRPDLAACIELKNEWIVLFGEVKTKRHFC